MNLSDLEKKWHQDITGDNVRFLGEVALRKDIFADLCKQLGERAVKRGKFIDKDGLALTVLAVNCAYFDYDAEFWAHFFKRLGVENTQALQAFIGNRFEITIDKYELPRKKRTGAFRYVGCLLEQCGVTRKSLDHFSRFLDQLIRDHGIDGVQVLPFSRFCSRVPDYGLPGYLSKFLCDQSGWQFLRDVARNISQYQRGILSLDDLKNIQGYHPSFWSELFPLLGTKRGNFTSQSIPIPKFFLDLSYRQLVLRFEREYVLQGRYSIDGSLVTSPRINVGDKLTYREEYEVEIKLDNNKITTAVTLGWDPRLENTKRAVFDVSGLFLRKVRRPGRYILVVPYSSKDLPQDTIEADLGLLNLPGIGPYKVLNVNLKDRKDINWANNCIDDEVDMVGDLISFSEGGSKLEGACDCFDVFVSKLPLVQVQNPETFASGENLLILSCGSEVKRIKVEERQNEIDLNEYLSPPVKGELWVEKVYRSDDDTDLGKLSFAVLPEGTSIQWPKGAFAIEDKPEIKATVPRSRIKFFNAQTSSRENSWVVDEGTWVVEGVLSYPDFKISLASQIRRVTLQVLNREEEDLLFVSDLTRGGKLKATGVPLDPVIVAATSVVEGSFSLGELGKFNGAGEFVFSSHAVQDSYLSKSQSISELGLLIGDQFIASGTWIVDSSELIADLERALENNYLSVIPDRFLGGDLKLFVMSLIRKTKLPASFTSLDVPSFLKKWVAGCLLCSIEFDEYDFVGTAIPELRSLARDVAEALDWYENAKSGKHQKEVPKWRPVLPRWQEMFNVYLSLVNDEEVYLEWAEDVRVGPAFTSRVACMENGKDLCDAWWRYIKSINLNHVYNSAARCVHSKNQLVSTLAKLLMEVCLIKSNKKSAVDMNIFDVPVPLECLPLHEEDLQIFKQYNGAKSWKINA